MKNNVYREGKVHVRAEKCGTCIFRPGNLMRLAPGRVEAMVKEACAKESAIVCHATLDTDKNAVCRGFFDKHGGDTLTLRLAQMQGVVKEVV